MNTFLEQSVFFGVFVSLAAYAVGVFIKNKTKFSLFNPLLISIIITSAVVIFAGIDYDVYYEGAKYISYLLTPATVALAIPLYEQVTVLRRISRRLLPELFRELSPAFAVFWQWRLFSASRTNSM